MRLVLQAARRSDGEIFYFRDQESYDDYVLTYEEEFEPPTLTFDVPFGKTIIDWNETRAQLEVLFQANGLDINQVSKLDLLGLDSKDHSYEGTEDRLKEARKISKKTFEVQNGKLVATDDDPREIQIRQKKALNNEIFKTFIDGLDDIRRNTITDVFSQHSLNLDNLEDYFDQELNMDISIWLQDYDTERDFLIALRDFKKTDTYKVHENFMKAMEESYEAIRKLDINNDQYLVPTADLSDPEIIPNEQNDELTNKVAVNGKYQDKQYNF